MAMGLAFDAHYLADFGHDFHQVPLGGNHVVDVLVRGGDQDHEDGVWRMASMSVARPSMRC